MSHTAFPATPRDVAILTAREFTFELDEINGARPPSVERACRTFMDDANRALVWWIRLEALKAWCASTDAMARLNAGSVTVRDVCDVAARFPLNHEWAFESDDFCSAVDAHRSGRRR